MILAGDIGGTKTLLSLFNKQNDTLIKLKSKRYISGEYSNLNTIVADFLKGVKPIPQKAVFGIPGPASKGKIKLTNLPWIIDAKELSEKTGIRKIELVNDLAAAAFNIPFLDNKELAQIKQGTDGNSSDNFIIIAPGTGLGEAFLICKDGKRIIIPSEGGHTDFAPTEEMEVELYRFLAKKYGHVSYERVISGMGIPSIFEFLVEINFSKPKPSTLERMKTEDMARVITDTAMHDDDRVSKKTMEIFIKVLAAHAGNLVITMQASGGVYLGGGIPHKILPLLLQNEFSESFTAKGRLKSLTDATPVFVITNNDTALYGAARMAFELE